MDRRKNGGTLRLSWRSDTPRKTHLLAAACAIITCSTVFGQDNVMGRWDPPTKCDPNDPDYEWPVFAVHATYLSNGEILFWQFGGVTAKLWNTNSGCFTNVMTELILECSGLVAMAEGSILVAGGGDEQANPGDPPIGIVQAKLYRLGGSPNGPWEEVAPMNCARWYPTCTLLPDGKVLVVSGKDEEALLVETPEIYTLDALQQGGGSWEAIPSANLFMPVYPFMFVLPYGDYVFYAGSHGGGNFNNGETYILDLSTPQSWGAPLSQNFATKRCSIVMYEPGKVLKCGGWLINEDNIDMPVPFTETIDLSDAANPGSWQIGAPMNFARRDHELVLLADGTILAIGGAIPGDNDMDEYILAAELFDPNALEPDWDVMASMVKSRDHHSTALLLADGRVLTAGTPNDDPTGPSVTPTAEIYSPAYLFNGSPPIVGYAPTALSYGTTFRVILSNGSEIDAAAIDKVTLIRLGSATHNINMDQRYRKLDSEVFDPLTLIVTAPPNGNEAPPGYYMLFLISDAGVPSVAKIVKLQ